jgi:hypothetical protein
MYRGSVDTLSTLTELVYDHEPFYVTSKQHVTAATKDAYSKPLALGKSHGLGYIVYTCNRCCILGFGRAAKGCEGAEVDIVINGKH